jgi:hypothetical protein
MALSMYMAANFQNLREAYRTSKKNSLQSSSIRRNPELKEAAEAVAIGVIVVETAKCILRKDSSNPLKMERTTKKKKSKGEVMLKVDTRRAMAEVGVEEVITWSKARAISSNNTMRKMDHNPINSNQGITGISMTRERKVADRRLLGLVVREERADPTTRSIIKNSNMRRRKERVVLNTSLRRATEQLWAPRQAVSRRPKIMVNKLKIKQIKSHLKTYSPSSKSEKLLSIRTFLLLYISVSKM